MPSERTRWNSKADPQPEDALSGGVGVSILVRAPVESHQSGELNHTRYWPDWADW